MNRVFLWSAAIFIFVFVTACLGKSEPYDFSGKWEFVITETENNKTYIRETQISQQGTTIKLDWNNIEGTCDPRKHKFEATGSFWLHDGNYFEISLEGIGESPGAMNGKITFGPVVAEGTWKAKLISR